MTEPKRVDDELVEFVADALNDGLLNIYEDEYYALAEIAINAIQEWDAREVKNVIIKTS